VANRPGPSIGKVCDIVCRLVQHLQEVNVWDIELPKPPPQPLMIRAIEGGFEVQIGHIEESPALGPVLDRPVQALHLALSAPRFAKPFLLGVQQTMLLTHPVQPVCLGP
jgi:hypothetical protein